MTDVLLTILGDFWTVLGDMAPYLLLGFLVAGWLSVLIPTSFVERHLGSGGIWPVVKAAAIGIPLPLCSCSVIPVSASLRRHGAGRGATTAFLISTPQTGVDSIFVTYSLLGGVFAIYRPIAALICGIIGGAIVSGTSENSDAAAETDTRCTHACCAEGGRGKFYRAMAYGFGTLPRDIGKHLLVGLAIAAIISALVPEDYFSDVVPPGIGQILILMCAGIPVYVCATASIPIALALIVAGVTPGAAFAFLMTGPATNAATIATVWKVMGRRTAIIYLATMAAAALAGGIILDQIVKPADITGGRVTHWMLPEPVKWLCAAALLIVLGVAFFRGSPKAKEIQETASHD